MPINKEEFKNNLSEAFIQLVDSERGNASKLAKAVGETPSFVSNVKRGRPVNAIHLKAVGIVFGPQKILELLDFKSSTDNLADDQFKNIEKGIKNKEHLLGIEDASDELYEKVSNYLKVTYEAVKIMQKTLKRSRE